MASDRKKSSGGTSRNSKVYVGVIGVGYLGELHAKIYSRFENVELVGVVDVNETRAKKVASELKTDYFLNFRDLIGKIDCASVAVPASQHYFVSKELLKEGVHLLIEKPITTTVKQAKELISIAEANNLILHVGHIERFNPAILRLRSELIRNKEKPLFIECHRLSPFAFRGRDVGVVLDLMIHDLDIVLWLTDSAQIKKVESVGLPVLTDYEDIANCRLFFDNGCIANITSSRVARERLRKLRVFTKERYYSLDYIKPELVVYKKENRKRTEPKIISQNLPLKKIEPLTEELKSFIAKVSRKKGLKIKTNFQQLPVISGEEVIKVQKLACRILTQINRHFLQFKWNSAKSESKGKFL